MRTFFTLSLTLWIAFSFSQNLYFPPLAGMEWEQLAPEEAGWCAEKVDSLIRFVEEKDSRAFIILKDGKIVVEEYFGTFTQDSAWYWASAGKSLMGVMIGLAQEDGHLSIEDKTSDYLGEGWTACPPEEEARIAIRHQISMSSGLDDSLEPTGSTENCFDPECFQCLAEPGTRWAYHNSAYRIVQDVMEEATGINKNVYTFTRLGRHIGMSGLWFDYIFYSRARDMARFGLFTLARGTWYGDVIMADDAYFEAMTNSSQGQNQSYGYLWWLNGKPFYMLPGLQFAFTGKLIPEAPDDLIAALGKNDQKIYVVPSMGLVIVRQGERAGTIAPAASSFDNQLWQRIMDLECVTAAEEAGDKLPSPGIFPNPAREFITVASAQPLKELRLMDASGKLVRIVAGSGTARQDVSLQGLEAGLYFVQVVTERGVAVERVYVARW